MSVTNQRPPMPLEYFMNFMNIDPLLFNGINISPCVWTDESSCQFYWDQWNSGKQMYNREQLADCICSAYDKVANYLGTKPTLQWETETIEIDKHWFYRNGNLPIEEILFRTKWNNVKEFGQQLLEFHETATLTYEVVAADDFTSYAEFTTVVPPDKNVCDIQLHSQGFVIEPYDLIEFNEDSRVATIRVSSWNLVNPSLYARRSWKQPQTVTCDIANFLTEIDVYFDSIDPCKPAIEIIYPDNHECNNSCKDSIQPACARITDACNGYFKIVPQAFDEDGCVIEDEGNCAICSTPYKIKIHYRAGCHKACDSKCNSQCHCRQMIEVVSMLAACCLDEYPLCNCSCMSANILKWQVNTAFVPAKGDRWVVAASIKNEMVSGFGSKIGEIEAMLRLNQLIASENFCTRE